jgi:hypothetical protein
MRALYEEVHSGLVAFLAQREGAWLKDSKYPCHVVIDLKKYFEQLKSEV